MQDVTKLALEYRHESLLLYIYVPGKVHCKVIIGRNPIEANANTVAIQLPGNPAPYI